MLSTFLQYTNMEVLIAALLGALALSLIFTPLVIRLAHQMDWLAYPKADRWHEEPTALMGGIGIFAAATLTVWLLPGVPFPGLLWAGAALLFIAGFIDDQWEINPTAKFLVQVVATGLLIYSGYQFAPSWPFWLSIPLTFLWVIGITNAVNLLDNMDGLSAGIVAVSGAVLAVFAMLTGDTVEAAYALAIVGASAGFLRYNFNPAKVFMGDCGSLFLGYLVAALALMAQSSVPSSSVFGVMLVPAAVMAVPIFDTTLVTIVRILNGRSIAQGGRDHSSHRLVFLGLSERTAVLTLYAVSLVVGGLAVAFRFAELHLFYAIAVYMGVGMVVFGTFLSKTNVYGASDNEDVIPDRGEYAHLTVFKYKKVLGGVIADLLLVTASLVIAFFLRFENGLPIEQVTLLETAVVMAVLVKVSVFGMTGLYRGIWRHAGTPELVRTAAASLVASGALYGILSLYTTVDLSESVFVIDWLLTTASVVGVRFAFRGLAQLLASREKKGKRVLLYGAGSAGTLSLRAIRQLSDMEMQPVGFIDDDPQKQGKIVQGLKVLGSASDLPTVFREHGVEEVLVTASQISPGRMAQFQDFCRERGVACREFKLSFDKQPVESVYVGGDGAGQAAREM